MAATTYTPNGLVQTVTDGENNKTTYEYDGHDRLSKTRYPDTAKGAGTSSATDYEQPTYESLAGGTRTSGIITAFRNRGGDTIGFGYDALGRMTSKDRPNAEPDVAYGYDLLGRMISASQSGHSLAFGYDALGRLRSETGPLGTMTSEYDLAGQRTKLTWPDNFYVTYDHLMTGEVTKIRENGAASGVGVLASFGYDQLGRRIALTRGNGVVTSYDHDAVSRLESLSQDLPSTANDVSLGFTYNPASQIVSTTRSNDLYAWNGHSNGATSTTANGRNQIASWVTTLIYDSKGNVTQDGTYTYAYSSENLLISLANSATGAIQSASTYSYDPLMRLAKIDSSNSALDADLAYDGQEIVLEGLSEGRARRYVFGPGVDEPLVAYLVTSTGASRSWYLADERGSIVRQTDDSGTPGGGIGRYDEYGIGPGTSRFQYTGQYWLGDSNLHYYRARVYDPKLGRFLQPDPIGYDGGMNLYAYVGGDPVNFTDPTGLCGVGEVPVAVSRTSRPEGDVVALFRLVCHRLPAPAKAGGGVKEPGGKKGISSPVKQPALPSHIAIDPSCSSVIDLLTPEVQKAARDALKASLTNNPSGTAEWGFFVSERVFGGISIGERFTSGFQRSISGELVQRMKPTFPSSLFSGKWSAGLFLHAHPNNDANSPVSPGDQAVADDLGIVIAAIDKKGNITCTK